MSAESEHPAGPVVGIVLAAGAGTRMGGPKALMVAPDGEPWLARAVRTLEAGGCAEVLVVLGAAASRARALLPGAATHPTPGELRAAAPVAHEHAEQPLPLSTVDAAAGAVAPSTHAGAPPPRIPGAFDAPRETPATRPKSSPPGVPVHVVVVDDWADGLSASLRAGLEATRERGAGAAVITLVDLPGLAVAAVERMLVPPPLARTLRQALYDGRPGHPVVIGRDHFDTLAPTLHGDTGARPYLRAHGVELIDCTDLGGGDDVDTPSGHLDVG